MRGQCHSNSKSTATIHGWTKSHGLQPVSSMKWNRDNGTDKPMTFAAIVSNLRRGTAAGDGETVWRPTLGTSVRVHLGYDAIQREFHPACPWAESSTTPQILCTLHTLGITNSPPHGNRASTRLVAPPVTWYGVYLPRTSRSYQKDSRLRLCRYLYCVRRPHGSFYPRWLRFKFSATIACGLRDEPLCRVVHLLPFLSAFRRMSEL